MSIVVAVGACDTADYTVDWFDDDDEEETAEGEGEGEGEDGEGGGAQQPVDRPFPNLSSVPERPGPPEIKLEAVSAKEGLVADKNNARYTDQELRSQTANVRPRPRVPSEPQAPETDGPAPADSAVRPSAPPPPPPGTPAARRPPPAPAGSPAATRAAPTPAAPAPAEAQVAVKPSDTRPTPSATAQTAGRPQPMAAAPQPMAAAPQPRAAPQPAAQPRPAAATQTAARQPRVPPRAPAPEPVRQDAAPERPRPAPPPVAAVTAPQGTGSAQGTAMSTPAPAQQPVVRPGTTTLIATIYFADGQTVLTAQDLEVLRQVLNIQQDGGGMLRVVGHSSMSSGIADPVRRRMANFKVSLDRATMVARNFQDLGLSGDSVVVEARGDSQPIYSEETAAGAAANRRAEIFLDR